MKSAKHHLIRNELIVSWASSKLHRTTTIIPLLNGSLSIIYSLLVVTRRPVSIVIPPAIHAASISHTLWQTTIIGVTPFNGHISVNIHSRATDALQSQFALAQLFFPLFSTLLTIFSRSISL